jgi:hypothetical protein
VDRDIALDFIFKTETKVVKKFNNKKN